MNAIDNKFTELFKNGELGLMTHVILGYPNKKISKQIIDALINSGSDFLELQMPFSEPIADGPVYFDANQVALENGISVPECFQMILDISKQTDLPLVIMSYYNIIYRFGVDAFLRKAKQCGVSGMIVPDLPFEEAHDYLRACNKHKICPIFIITKTTSIERIKVLEKKGKGFLYCVARTGITGQKTQFNQEFQKFIKKVRSICRLPLGVGFGVKTKEDIKRIAKHVDMAIVGTAIAKTYREQGVEGIKNLVKSLKLG